MKKETRTRIRKQYAVCLPSGAFLESTLSSSRKSAIERFEEAGVKNGRTETWQESKKRGCFTTEVSITWQVK